MISSLTILTHMLNHIRVTLFHNEQLLLIEALIKFTAKKSLVVYLNGKISG